MVATPSLVDPQRAPEGHHTVKFLTHTVCDLPGVGAAGWAARKEAFANRHIEKIRRFCPNFTDDVILGRVTKSPGDIEAENPHMVQGAPMGAIARSHFQANSAQHRGGLATACRSHGFTKQGAQRILEDRLPAIQDETLRW